MERRQLKSEVYEALPQDLKNLTEGFEGREKDIVLLSTLGVLSNCIPNVNGIYDGDTIYTHIYIMIIAPAASGKGVMNYSRILIDSIHKKIFNKSRSAYFECQEQQKSKKKGTGEPCPEIAGKIIPANISSAEMYSFLGSSNHGILIMESEADTMSNMLNNDWSNYSDVLRKAFHHEPVSISRKLEKVFLDIDEPKLSIVLSGTPGQLQPLVSSKENGLFSRFAIYNFDEISSFKNVFAAKTRDAKEPFMLYADQVFSMYDELSLLEKPIEFSFTDNQIGQFLERLRFISKDILSNYAQGFISNVNRHGLILFRLAMILTLIRNRENLTGIEKIHCADEDFENSLMITQTLLRHSQFTYDSMSDGVLSLLDGRLLDSLASSFTTKQGYAAGEKFQVKERTMVDKFDQWSKKKLIKRVKKGHYKKV